MVALAADQRQPFVRLLHRSLDLPTYFEAVDRALVRVVPFDASCWLSLDPATFLPTSHFSAEYGFDQLLALAANEFLDDDVNKFADLARTDPPVGVLSRATDGRPERSRRHESFLAPYGFGDGDELRAVFRDGEAVWGAVAVHRRHGTFTERDVAVVGGLGELVAHGIRRAILTNALTATADPGPPGLILLRDDDSVETISASARHWLGELFDTTSDTYAVPMTVTSVASQARGAASGDLDGLASVRLPTRSGGWVRMDASVLDDGQRVAVVISSAREPEVAELIAQVYGLSAREREVTRLVLHGRSTNEIAAALDVSPYTVQDHLKSIFEKVGVRSRRELVAQLFLQQCAPRLAAGRGPGVDGWFVDDGVAAALPS